MWIRGGLHPSQVSSHTRWPCSSSSSSSSSPSSCPRHLSHSLRPLTTSKNNSHQLLIRPSVTSKSTHCQGALIARNKSNSPSPKCHPLHSPVATSLSNLLLRLLFHLFIMMPIVISMFLRSLSVSSTNCFGGIESFEKVAMTDFSDSYTPAGILLQQPDQALTRDCINLCKQQSSCLSFSLDYVKFRCAAYSIPVRQSSVDLVTSNSSNFFEKVCYRGIPREEYEKICGLERLWTFERVASSFLEGKEQLQLNNIASRSECAKACLTESSFTCRSADYDTVLRICRLSKEDRRSSPESFKTVAGSSREYLENQCAPPSPSACLYETRSDTSVITMDSLIFANGVDECQSKCDKEHTFNCRAYSIMDKKCFLSGDDSISLLNSQHPSKPGSLYGEKKCITENCAGGVFTYEKITGYTIRTSVVTPIATRTASLGITQDCRSACDNAGLACPAFTVNYASSRCEKLDRGTQGKTMDLIPREGESIFEKVCLRVHEATTAACRDKMWTFERVIGHELVPSAYSKTYSFVQSRRDCMEYCLHESSFPCRSAYYDEETTECKLSPDDRRTRPHSYVRSPSHRVSYLENQCVTDHSRCSFVEVPNAYPTYTDQVDTHEGIDSHSSCERLCSNSAKFLCRSFAYYSSNSQCFLSGDDRFSAGQTAITNRPGMNYYERRCDAAAGNSSSDVAISNLDDTSISMHGLKSDDAPSIAVTIVPSSGPQASPSSKDSVDTLSSPTQPTPPVGSSTPNPSHQSRAPPSPPSSYQTGPQSHTGHSHNNLDQVKCGANFKFTFERVPNFEPIGGLLGVLYSDPSNPGIVDECIARCASHPNCQAFVLDYNHRSCHGLFDNTTVGKFDLRLSIGKDYFEGFCIPNHLSCHKLWHFDRIVDQSTVGPNPSSVIRFISRAECKIRCLQERKFPCASASFDGHLNECKLYSLDRHSHRLALSFTKGIDYLENTCAIDPSTCSFLPYERDVSMISVAASARSSSTFFCEQLCAQEKDFNCRSFTYIEGSTIPGANLCLLSADTKKASQRGSAYARPRALYGERDCSGVHLSGRTPDGSSWNRPRESRITNFGPSVNSIGSSNSYDPMRDTSSYYNTLMMMMPYNSYTPISGQSSGPQYHMHQMSPVAPVASPPINSPPVSASEQIHTLPPPLSPDGPVSAEGCNFHQFTFEKTYGHDMRYARKDRSRLPPRLGVAVQCQDECIRRRYRCNAFIIEYGPVQSCFFLEESAGENRRVLQSVPDVAYFEKICLKNSPCGKIWTFDRIIGHDLDVTAEKEVTGLTSRTECQDLCLGEKSFVCRAASYNYSSHSCKLFTESKRSKPTALRPVDSVDYFENQCAKEPVTCQYKDHADSFLPLVDRLTTAFSLSDCQRQCDAERAFNCRSVSYETFARDCALHSEDTMSVGSTNAAVSLISRRHSIYSEKGSCEQISVQCTPQDMLLTLNFDSPFSGRVYAKGNPSACYVLGTGSPQLQFAISLGSKCGTKPEGEKNFANEVVIQQHPVIMTDSDRTVRVVCTFDAVDQTVTLMSPLAERPGIDVHKKSYLYSGIDSIVSGPDSSYGSARTRLDSPISSVVTNTAPPPAVFMRILDASGKDASVVSLGDELTLQIELRDPTAAFGIFARNLYARSSNGESLFLLDNTGCPTDSLIFPSLKLDPKGSKALSSTFKAFRFPSSGIVNFEVQVRFCQDKCDPVKCTSSSSGLNTINFGQTSENESFGRRRRSVTLATTEGSVDEMGEESDAETPEAPVDEELEEETSVSTSESTTEDQSATSTTQPPQSARLLSPVNQQHTLGPHPEYPGINYMSTSPVFQYPHPYMNAASGSSYPYTHHQSQMWPGDSSSVYSPHPMNYSSSYMSPMMNPYQPMNPISVSTVDPLSKPLYVQHSSRPLPTGGDGIHAYRPPRPLSRPPKDRTSPATAGQDTLSTTIRVGEKEGDTNSASEAPIHRSFNLDRVTGSSRLSCSSSGSVILYTAIVTTLVHMLIVVVGYLYYRKIGTHVSSSISSRPSAAVKLFSSPSFSEHSLNPPNINLSSGNISSTNSLFHANSHSRLFPQSTSSSSTNCNVFYGTGKPSHLSSYNQSESRGHN